MAYLPLRSRLACWACCLLFSGTAATALAADPSGMQFFEAKIRPVLVKECYDCHSTQSKNVKGGLLLDSREGVLAGGESGPSVDLKNPDESLLLQALRHDGLEMPPTKRLPPEVIADFEKWITLGAPDPRVGKAPQKVVLDIDAGRQFWSFRPLQATKVPAVKDAAWAATDVDRYILAALESKGLQPVADADRRALLRRISFDLTGLPPSPAEQTEFLADNAPDAWVKVVDRLLAAPQFGERWGRHWLDLARYADSNGKDENFTYYNAWRYRDYVIASFNADKPLPTFLTEQLAGDLLPAKDQAQRDEYLVATGLLMLGPKVLAERNKPQLKLDIVDEQIDTVGKALLGLTLGCARCHDHKFDPVAAADYYALAGIFGSTHTLEGRKDNMDAVSGWMERGLGSDAETKIAAIKEYEKQLKANTTKLAEARKALLKVQDKAEMKEPALLAGIVVDNEEAETVGFWKHSTLSRPYVGKGYIHDDKLDKGQKSVTFTPDIVRAGEYEVLLAYTPGKGRETQVPITIRHAKGESKVQVDQVAKPPLQDLYRSLGKFEFAAGKSGKVVISNAGTSGYVIVDAVRFVPTTLQPDPTQQGVAPDVEERLAEAKRTIAELEALNKELKANKPKSPEMAMAVRDYEKPANSRIYIRGEIDQPGDEVPRGFIRVVSAETSPEMPGHESGRIQFAQWLTGPAQHLVARVYVNRVWHHLFGHGLVRTVDNFGKQGEAPSHPELLDYLATRFIAENWSTKQLIRHLALSRVYQLGNTPDPKAATIDPENRLLGHAHRRRLQAEAIRDAMLSVSGRLDPTLGGTAVAELPDRALANNRAKGGIDCDALERRSVYLPLVRNDLPQLLQVFDFANADVTTGARDVTTVPTQALYLMNSPFAQKQAKFAAARLLAESATSDAERVERLYRRAIAREATREEVAAALRFLDEYRRLAAARGSAEDSPDLISWAAFCQAMFGSTEFRYLE